MPPNISPQRHPISPVFFMKSQQNEEYSLQLPTPCSAGFSRGNINSYVSFCQ